MKTKNENLDDIVFENKNKDYGAYSIRKGYNRGMNRALFIAVLIFLVGISIPLLANLLNSSVFLNDDKTVTTVLAPPPKPSDVKPPPLKKIEPQKIDKQLAPKAPKVVSDTTDSAGDLVDLFGKLNNLNPNIPKDNDSSGFGNRDTTNVIIDYKPKVETYTYVEEMPEYNGGEEARVMFLKENIKYPQIARETGIEGTVYIKFVVNEKGDVVETSILRGIGGGCDEEALRVVNKMPDWKPGRQNGNSVRVEYSMPVRFSLQ
ncbi:MAG: TonB family protein [Bacteroidota bacterium]